MHETQITEAAPVVPKPTNTTKPTKRTKATTPTGHFQRSRWALAGCALLLVGVVSLATSCGNGGGGSSAARTTGASAQRTTTTTIPPRSGAMTSFGNGTFNVGIRQGEVAPGTYRTRGGSRCYWARLRSGTGSVSDLIVNDFALGPAIVTIHPGDKAFQSFMCAGWRQMPNSGVPATSFGDGTWAVGIDIAPGTYHSPGGVGCQWERLSAFGAVGTTGVIARDRPRNAPTVTIASTDMGFSTSHCGTWTQVG